MRLPDFIIIGAAKAGTTSLHALLDRHPRLFMSDPKEPEFFARDDRYGAGIAEYAALFEAAGTDRLAGEASTIYSLSPFFPEAAARMHAHVPEAKIVYVLRHPVDRAYSYYTQIIKNYQNDTRDYAVHRSFEEFVLPDRHARAAPREKVFARFDAHLPDTPELCLAGSDYPAQIRAYLAHFPRENMLFLTFEAFRRDREAAMRRITDFLGLPPLDPALFADAGTTRNVSRDYFEGVGGTRRIASLKQRFSWLWGARRLLPRGMRGGLRNAVARQGGPDSSHVPPPMTPETRVLLEARFAAQLDEIAELTGLDLSDWHLGGSEEEMRRVS